MSSFLQDYLHRIGYGGPTSASAATLFALHEAHAAAIPFENIDVLLGRPLDLSTEGIARKLVAARRGGYCYEHNLLLHDALSALGFSVTPLAARVRMGYAGPRPRTHALLKVEADGRSWIADVGFGLMGLLEPLPLMAGAEADLPLARFRLDREAESWIVRARPPAADWQDLYLFSLEPQQRVDFVMANHFTATWPQSPFTRSLIAARVRRDRRAVLTDRSLRIATPAGEAFREAASPGDLAGILAEEFALDAVEPALLRRLFPAG